MALLGCVLSMAMPGCSCRGGCSMGGTLTSWLVCVASSSSTCSALCGVGVERVGGSGWSEARCWVLRERRLPRATGSCPSSAGWWVGGWFAVRTSLVPVRCMASVGVGVAPGWVGWDRPYLENCTVDASIFVVKLLRAHGGCLGTRSR